MAWLAGAIGPCTSAWAWRFGTARQETSDKQAVRESVLWKDAILKDQCGREALHSKGRALQKIAPRKVAQDTWLELNCE